MNLDRLLVTNFGEGSCKISASIKKTIQVKQYEPKAFELETELNFDRSFSLIEKAVIQNTLEVYLEYSLICHLYKVGIISNEEFADDKNKLELSSEAILTKYEKLTGNSRDTILEMLNIGDSNGQSQ